MDHRIWARCLNRILRNTALDTTRPVPRRHFGRRGRSGVRQRSFFLLVGIAARSGTAAFAYRPNPDGATHPHRSVAIPTPEQSRAISAIWVRQGMILGSLWCVTFGARQFLARYHLVWTDIRKSWPVPPM